MSVFTRKNKSPEATRAATRAHRGAHFAKTVVRKATVTGAVYHAIRKRSKVDSQPWSPRDLIPNLGGRIRRVMQRAGIR